MALVGGGGKTSALGQLAREMAAAGSRVVVTTTTAMFQHELAAVGPIVMEADKSTLTARLRTALAGGQIVAVAHSPQAPGKVAGLAPAVVDWLWAEALVDHLVVEADGSRGRSLKAFAAHEPRVPAATATIVQVAGLDAIGRPLSDEYVHRAGTLAAALGLPLGSEVTTRVFADGLQEQLRRLQRILRGSRVVTLLNKADGPEAEGLGLDVSQRLLAGDRERADAVVIASLRQGRYARVCASEV